MSFLKSFKNGIGFGLGMLFTLATATFAVSVTGNVNIFKSGEIVSAATLNENFASLKTAIEGLPDCSPHYARVSRASGVTVADGTPETISWNTEELDTAGMWQAGSPTRITIQKNGLYHVGARAGFQNNAGAGATRSIAIVRNSATVTGFYNEAFSLGNTNSQQEVSEILYLNQGDYLEVVLSHRNGGNLVILGMSFYVARICSGT